MVVGYGKQSLSVGILKKSQQDPESAGPGKHEECGGNALVLNDGDDGDEVISCVGAIFYFTHCSRSVVLSAAYLRK